MRYDSIGVVRRQRVKEPAQLIFGKIREIRHSLYFSPNTLRYFDGLTVAVARSCGAVGTEVFGTSVISGRITLEELFWKGQHNYYLFCSNDAVTQSSLTAFNTRDHKNLDD